MCVLKRLGVENLSHSWEIQNDAWRIFDWKHTDINY